MNYITKGMSLEAINPQERSPELIPIERAQLEIIQLGENIAKEIKNLKEASKVMIIITAIFNNNLDFSNPELVSLEIDNVRKSLLEICDNAEIPEPEAILQLKEIIQSFDFGSPLDLKELISKIDKLLLEVIKNESIPLTAKSKFFQKIKGICEVNHQNSVANKIQMTESTISLSQDMPLPVNVSYILNPEMISERDAALRRLKNSIQTQESLLFQYSASEYIEKIHGTDLIDAEEEYYRQSEFYNSNKPELVENTVPKNKKEGYPLELIVILKGGPKEVTFRQLNMAKIQLLRIYREFINTLITTEIIDNRIIEEQLSELENSLRIGIDETSEAEIKRRKQTRRISLFDMLHMGTVAANKVNPNMTSENQVPLSQEVLDYTGGTKPANTSRELFISKLTKEQRRRFEVLESLKDYQFDETQDGIPSRIYRRFIEKLGIATPLEDVDEQLELSEKKIPNNKFKTYTIKVRPGGTVAVDHGFRTILIPRTWKPKLSSILISIQHEIGHVAQQLSRDQSFLPGVNILSGLGRSGTLAEAGAIKSEALMAELLTKEREINTYHVSIVKGIIEGKNYWELVEMVLKTLFERNIRNNENKSKEELARTAIKTVNRAYSSLGAMGNKTDPHGRYPTCAGFLSYTYQGLPEFSQQPFYISGIPAHRIDLQEFMPQPQIEGVPITEELIAEIIIDAAYEVLAENGIINTAN